MRMKRKVVQKLMCAMLASSMLMTGFGVEAFASEDKNQQELSTEGGSRFIAMDDGWE